jgi:hypothetical protein
MLALLLPVLLLAAGAAIFLPAPVEANARFVQHLLSLLVQVLSATTASVMLVQVARTYGPRDHERRVWRLAAAAALVWAAGLLVYALREWFGQARAYPSAADSFLVVAFLLLLLAMAAEFRLVRSMLTRRQRRILLGAGVLLWLVVIGGVMWPLLASPLDSTEKALDVFYASMIALLVPLALGPAMAFRGGASGYVWLGVAVGVACLTLASLGFAYLTTYELYTDVHPINLLRVAGLAALAASGAWHRRMIEAV